MPKVLIVSPHFPPINAPDMQRVRMSLPYFSNFGWEPLVLTVEPRYVEVVQDHLLLQTLPPNITIHAVRALPVRWTRKLGIGDLALRSMPFLYATGADLIRKYDISLVYFSTTMFSAMTLGRIWKTQYGVPFVLDIQDPWRSEYHEIRSLSGRPPKYRLAQKMHRVLEAWTMVAADGLIAVSQAYIETLHRRYPWLTEKPSAALPFGASAVDIDIVRANPQQNRFFQPGDGKLHGVYVGRGGADMAFALHIMFRALKKGLQENPTLFSRVYLHFIGTDYAPGESGHKTVEPIAREYGVDAYIEEHPPRIAYFEAMQLLLDADFLLIPGSDDPQYTASKIYPYILARQPLLGVFHERSSVVDIVHRTQAGTILPFNLEMSEEHTADQFLSIWHQLLTDLPFEPQTDWNQFSVFTAREMTRHQCELFEQILEAKH